MAVEISSALLLRLMRQVLVFQPRRDGKGLALYEWCGILRGHGERVLHGDFTPNVAPDPERAFEIDPQALIRAYRLARRPGGLEVLGFFHTHPYGPATPSPRDAESAAPDGRLWIISGRDGVLVWRAVEDGAVHGRFDRVTFDLRTGARVETGCSGVRWRGLELEYQVRFELEARGEI